MEPAWDRKVAADIQRYRSLGQFPEGHQYAESLSPETCAHKEVALELIQFYVVFGHSRLAEKAYNHVAGPLEPGRHDEISEVAGTPDAQSSCLELLRALLLIARLSKPRTALRMTKKIGEQWNLDTGLSPTQLYQSSLGWEAYHAPARPHFCIGRGGPRKSCVQGPCKPCLFQPSNCNRHAV